MSIWKDIIGTTLNKFALGILGNILKSSGGRVEIRNTGDSAFAALIASRLDVEGNDLIFGSEITNRLTLRRNTSQGAPLTFTFPSTNGSAGQVLSNDGTGNLSWASAGSTANRVGCDTTSLAFGSAATVTMFTLPANAVITMVRVTVDTPFNGTPTISVGVTGTTSKYLASSQVDLKQPAATQFEVYPALPPNASSEALIISYAAGGATAGSARVEVFYCNPD